MTTLNLLQQSLTNEHITKFFQQVHTNYIEYKLPGIIRWLNCQLDAFSTIDQYALQIIQKNFSFASGELYSLDTSTVDFFLFFSKIFRFFT